MMATPQRFSVRAAFPSVRVLVASLRRDAVFNSQFTIAVNSGKCVGRVRAVSHHSRLRSFETCRSGLLQIFNVPTAVIIVLLYYYSSTINTVLLAVSCILFGIYWIDCCDGRLDLSWSATYMGPPFLSYSNSVSVGLI